MKLRYVVSKLRSSRLINNMKWLFILNFSNTIIPYLTFPYITRIFLPEGYGRISFALAFVAYFQTIIEYGFNLTGARLVAKNEHSKDKISKIYTSIILTKFLFFILSIIVIFFIVSLNSRMAEYRLFIHILLIMVFSNVIMPTWLFQGLQKMKFMTVVSLLARSIFVSSVFLLIKSIDDIYLYTLLYSLSFLLISLLSLCVVRFHLKVKLSKITLEDIKYMIQDGFYVFTSSAVIRIMGSTGVFVLGLFHSSTLTGYYSGISKIVQVITMMFYPIGQALFPFICKSFDESFEKGYTVSTKLAKIIVPLFILPTILLVVFRYQVVQVTLGSDFSAASDILIFIGFLPILSIISNFLGTQVLVAGGYMKEYSRAFFKGSIISVFLFISLGYFFSLWGVSIAAVLGSIINLLFLHIEIIKVKKTFWNYS